MDIKMKPILFSTPMIPKLLDGTKTQTRRAIKAYMPNAYDEPRKLPNGSFEFAIPTYAFGESGLTYEQIKPKYQIGDILWVREAWQEVFDPEHNTKKTPIRNLITNWNDIPKTKHDDKTGWGTEAYYVYKASDIKYANDDTLLNWCSSMYMPKEAARIFLRVKDVRAERLQDISEEDAKAEGVSAMTTPNISGIGRSYRQGFGELWNTINAKKKEYLWDSNPFIWAYTFERIDIK